jgi:hypothetical protein
MYKGLLLGSGLRLSISDFVVSPHWVYFTISALDLNTLARTVFVALPASHLVQCFLPWSPVECPQQREVRSPAALRIQDDPLALDHSEINVLHQFLDLVLELLDLLLLFVRLKVPGHSFVVGKDCWKFGTRVDSLRVCNLVSCAQYQNFGS